MNISISSGTERNYFPRSTLHVRAAYTLRAEIHKPRSGRAPTQFTKMSDNGAPLSQFPSITNQSSGNYDTHRD